MLDHIKGDLFAEFVYEVGQFGSGTNKAHVTFEYIKELGELVQRIFADESSERSFAVVFIGGPTGGLTVIYSHGTEFIHAERLVVAAYAFLLENDWKWCKE